MSCPQCVQAGKEGAVNHSKSDADLLVLLIVETTICPMVNKFISEQRKKQIYQSSHWSRVRCYMSGITCHLSQIKCHILSYFTFPLSPMLTATPTDTPLANFPTMHSRQFTKTEPTKPKRVPEGPPVAYNALFQYSSDSLIMFKKEGLFINQSNHIANKLGFYLNPPPKGTSQQDLGLCILMAFEYL